MAPRRTGDASGNAAAVDPQDRLGDGPADPGRGRAHAFRQGLDVQFLGEPAVLRGRRPRHAGAWRHGLFAPQAVRAHLPPPPPLPHHRGQRGNPEAEGGGVPVRLYGGGEALKGNACPLKPVVPASEPGPITTGVDETQTKATDISGNNERYG